MADCSCPFDDRTDGGWVGAFRFSESCIGVVIRTTREDRAKHPMMGYGNGDRMHSMQELSNLEALLTRLISIDFSQSSEQATREMAVNPVIGALGWDTFDPGEVVREYSVRGGRVDYCLRRHKRNLVMIEVKRAGTNLSEHQEQLLRYAFDEGVELAVLTDGLVWWLYLPMAGGTWEQRCFSRITCNQQTCSGAATAIYRFLGRDGVIGGSALKEAKREFESQERDRRVRVAVRDAWLRVLADPKGLLRDLLVETAEEISGYRPTPEVINEFLQGVSGDDIVFDSVRNETKQPPSGPNADDVVPPDKKKIGRRLSVPPVAFWLDGKRHDVRTWRQMLVRLCELVADGAGSVFPVQVTKLRGRKRPYFSSSSADLREPLPIPGTNLFVEGNVSATQAERIAKGTLRAVRNSEGGFRVERADRA